MQERIPRGRIVSAPEHFVSASLQQDIARHGLDSPRRDFLRKSFLGAAAGVAAATLGRRALAAQGDPAILEPQPWATSLGQPVAARPVRSAICS